MSHEKKDRYFLCNGLKENFITRWSEFFKINDYYKFDSDLDERCMRLIAKNGKVLIVDRDQFEEIKIISVDKETGVLHCIRLDATRTPEIIVSGELKGIGTKSKIKQSNLEWIKKELSEPNISVERMNQLLDELNELK